MRKLIFSALALAAFCLFLVPRAQAAEKEGEKATEALKGHIATDKDKDFVDKHEGSYALKTCVVSGKALPEKPILYVYEDHLVKFCCPMCVKPFEKDSAKYLTMIDDAAKKTAKPEEKPK